MIDGWYFGCGNQAIKAREREPVQPFLMCARIPLCK